MCGVLCVWDLRAAIFCPSTWQQLIANCYGQADLPLPEHQAVPAERRNQELRRLRHLSDLWSFLPWLLPVCPELKFSAVLSNWNVAACSKINFPHWSSPLQSASQSPYHFAFGVLSSVLLAICDAGGFDIIYLRLRHRCQGTLGHSIHTEAVGKRQILLLYFITLQGQQWCTAMVHNVCHSWRAVNLIEQSKPHMKIAVMRITNTNTHTLNGTGQLLGSHSTSLLSDTFPFLHQKLL